jgi:N-acetylmannosamine-6-phosphate 2-epimerase / N-acetylmannosamine kinase
LPPTLCAYGALAAYLAEGVGNIFNILDPQAVIISGGLIEGHPSFVAAVENRVAALLYFGAKRTPRASLRPRAGTLGYGGGLIGLL